MLSEEQLNLTAVRLLAPHLTEKNHLALLAEAVHKSKTEVGEVLARWFPRPDVAASIRKLPVPKAMDAPRTVDGNVAETRGAAGGPALIEAGRIAYFGPIRAAMSLDHSTRSGTSTSPPALATINDAGTVE